MPSLHVSVPGHATMSAIPPAPAAPRSSVSIVTPQGFRVEGLDLEAAADLLKRLG